MAVTKYIAIARKLQTACNKQFGARILINTRQWYSEDKGRAVTVYTIFQSVKKEDKEKDVNVELFKTYSQIQLVLFLRDYWYSLNGWDIPHDNEEWEQIKEKYEQETTCQNN